MTRSDDDDAAASCTEEARTLAMMMMVRDGEIMKKSTSEDVFEMRDRANLQSIEVEPDSACVVCDTARRGLHVFNEHWGTLCNRSRWSSGFRDTLVICQTIIISSSSSPTR